MNNFLGGSWSQTGTFNQPSPSMRLRFVLGPHRESGCQKSHVLLKFARKTDSTKFHFSAPLKFGQPSTHAIENCLGYKLRKKEHFSDHEKPKLEAFKQGEFVSAA